MTTAVHSVLKNYTATTPGGRSNIARILRHGKMGGTGKLLILAIDQGFEHGPLRSFSPNTAAYDPAYHFELGIKSGVSALSAPLGFLEAAIDKYPGAIPTILKMNSANTLTKTPAPSQAVTASVDDALRLGCSGIGFTLYPGSADSFVMFEELQALSAEAKSKGLAVVVWSYPRGDISKAGETSLDVTSYGAHMACLLGADIVKCKIPTDHIELPESKNIFGSGKIPYKKMQDRIKYMVQSCFDGKRLIIFSGGATKDDATLLGEIQAIQEGNGAGTIIGRNIFQRPESEALALIQKIQTIYMTP